MTDQVGHCRYPKEVSNQKTRLRNGQGEIGESYDHQFVSLALVTIWIVCDSPRRSKRLALLRRGEVHNVVNDNSLRDSPLGISRITGEIPCR